MSLESETLPNPTNASRFLISVFPFVCLVLAWVLARGLRLEGNH